MPHRRSLWLYPLFQIPMMAFGVCLILAALFWLLGFGRPQVAVAIALDLSSSTYGFRFNAPGSVMEQEIQAVRSYLAQNSPQMLRNPNQIQIFGFAGKVEPLTPTFATDSRQIDQELTQALQNPDLPQKIVTNSTNLDLAIQEGTQALSRTQQRCRELLLVTDGEAPVAPEVIATAQENQVKINAIVIGDQAPAVRLASFQTGGIYLSGTANTLEDLFTEKFFVRFNSNIRWIIFWLGGAWIALMWAIALPLDRWIFQGWLNFPMNLAGQLALSHALFWSVLVPILVWQVWGLPFGKGC